MDTITKKIIQIDGDVDNSYYELKVPYEFIDEFGNRSIQYKREIIKCSEVEDLKQEQRAQTQDHQQKLIKCQERVAFLNSLSDIQKPT